MILEKLLMRRNIQMTQMHKRKCYDYNSKQIQPQIKQFGINEPAFRSYFILIHFLKRHQNLHFILHNFSLYCLGNHTKDNFSVVISYNHKEEHAALSRFFLHSKIRLVSNTLTTIFLFSGIVLLEKLNTVYTQRFFFL